MVPPERTHESYINGISWKDNWETGQFIHQTFTELYGDRYGCGFQRVTRSMPQHTGQEGTRGTRGKLTTCVFGRGSTKGQRQWSGSRKTKGGDERWWGLALSLDYDSSLWLEIGTLLRGSARKWGWRETPPRPWWLSARERCSLVGLFAPWEDSPSGEVYGGQGQGRKPVRGYRSPHKEGPCR